MAVKTVIIGAAGRMGRELVAAVMADQELRLTGAVEWSGCAELGRDAGLLAGRGAAGVEITADLGQVLAEADAVIDFSALEAVLENAERAVAAGCAIVIGTTGLGEQEKTALATLAGQGGRIVLAPNMSVGINLLFDLCRRVAPVLGTDYDIEVVEMHHNQKKDAPSGTAVRMGEILAAATGRDCQTDIIHGRSGMVGARKPGEIGIHAVRGGDVVGDHTVVFATQGERVELTHKASSRQTFCKGALRAVKFLMRQEAGLFDMQKVLGLG